MIAELTKTYALGVKLMKEFGLTEQGWKFDISDEKNIVGRCWHSKKLITYSKYFLHVGDEEIEDTIRHEIAHALVGSRHGHDHTWRMMAIRCGAKPNRCAPDHVESAAKYNYEIRCTNCDKVTSRKYRLRQALLDRYISSCCGAKLYAIHLR